MSDIAVVAFGAPPPEERLNISKCLQAFTICCYGLDVMVLGFSLLFFVLCFFSFPEFLVFPLTSLPALLWRSFFSFLCSTLLPFVHLSDSLHLHLICSLLYLGLDFVW